ncbi:acyltransferase [Pseudomonas viridiflava]|uniref:acyltransferase n=1 Tax=Pseudomonas viridiflava TaxID=33069 RepID=UPI0012DF894F|nr:acyltransferase family protein [Pseudomonas viridiflava]
MGRLTTEMPKARDLSLDGVRFLAIFMVIVIHVSAKGFSSMGLHWWAVNFFESISRAAVPLFFMVSGALLLTRETRAKTSLKRIWRVALPLFVWSIVYLAWFQYTGTAFDEWVLRIFRGPVVAHFWYLYTLIGAYLFLPVLIGFFKIENTGSQLLAMVGWFIGSSLVPLFYALNQKGYLGLDWGFLTLYAGYIAAGALIYHKMKNSDGLLWLAAVTWSISVSATALFTWQHSISVGHADETYYVYSSPFVVMAALSSFVLLRALFNRVLLKSERICRFLVWAGKLNFGIYIVHVLVMFWFDLNGIDYDFANPWIAIPITSVAILIASGAMVYILQKIPLIRQTVPA